MSFSLDHVVIAVSDLDSAISDYGKLGFTVLRGGEHPRRGSINALIVFQDGTYFELIAFGRPAPGFRWWEVLQKSGGGFVDFAILPRNMEAGLKEAKARGFAAGPLEPGSRVTPEGQRVEWQTVRAPTSDVPFLCGDITPRKFRVPEGGVRDHANGVLGIAAITVAVSELALSKERYRALLQNGLADDGSDRFSARFLCEPGVIELRQPEPHAPDSLANWLETRGEGPFSVSLRAPKQIGALDERLTHGARLQIVSASSPYL